MSDTVTSTLLFMLGSDKCGKKYGQTLKALAFISFLFYIISSVLLIRDHKKLAFINWKI